MKYLILLFLLIVNLSASGKVALLIGNTDYKFQPLSNPLNDVRAIKKTLIEIGFEEEDIVVLENASTKDTLNALSKFRKRGEKADIALLYFSGHGIEISHTNYLFPANTTAKTSLDREELINLNSFIDSTSLAKYAIILIDACRTNPFVDYLQNITSKGFIISKGLGQVEADEDKKMIISFATKSGEVANDGKGNISPYAKALSHNLKLNLDIRPILGQVRKDVYRNNPPQKPIYEDSLGLEALCLTGNCKGEQVPFIEERRENQSNTSQIQFVEPNRKSVKKIGNLMYQSQPTLGRFNWKEAKRYCQELILEKHSDWRLPSERELKKILKREKIEQKEIHLWTQYKGKDGLVWAVSVDDNDWYRSETIPTWKSPSLCVKKIR